MSKYKALFDRAFAKLMGVEGGYANHPDDPGKETNHGITAKVARAYGYTGPMRDLPKEVAYIIAKKEYWDKLYLDYVAIHSERIACEMLDTGFNCGIGTAARFFQIALNVLQGGNPVLKTDGIMGPNTLEKYYRYLAYRGPIGEEVLLKALNCLQGAHYIDLCKENERLQAFVNGWFINRINIEKEKGA